jgi:hypothetical protein
VAVASGIPGTPPPAASKRSRPDEDTEMTPEEPRRPRGAGAFAAPPPGGRGAEGGQTAEEFGLNFPLPEEERRGHGSSTACMVKTYGGKADALEVLEVVEVIGVLCVDPEISRFEPLDPTGTLLSDACQPSTSLVPRLHAIMIRRLPFHHPLLPFAPAWLTEARLAAAYDRRFPGGPAALAAARDAALSALKRPLGGDALAAEYILMLLVSRAFGKQGDKLLGSWSMNIVDWPEAASARSLLDATAELVPRAVCLELTNETLHDQRWRPRKDYTLNRLVAGRLQLAAGTLLLLDETGMTEGQLATEAVRNIGAINELVTEQDLSCDFFYDVKLKLELSCILVSRLKSIFKAVDVALPLRPDTSMATLPVNAEALEAARFLIGLVTRNPQKLQIPEEMSDEFGNSFVAARQEFKVPPELCHTWLNLARARCLLHGESTLTLARWQEVLALERERLGRLRSREEGMLRGA